MKMNSFPWIRRILVCTAIVCLTVTGLGAQPAQASPPAEELYQATVHFIKRPLGPLCLGQEYVFSGYVTFTSQVMSARIEPEGKIESKLLGHELAGWFWTVDPGESAPLEFVYTASQEGDEQLDIIIAYPGSIHRPDQHYQIIGGTSLYFKVKPCLYSIHGTADMGAVVNAMMPVKVWDVVGTYDVAGTIKMNEDGKSSGQGTVNLFTDAFFIGGAEMEGITCDHLSPWEGNSAIEIEADPNAWANENVLKLTLTIQPMQINTTRVVCQGDEGYGWADSPALSVASFDLNPQALPAEGGSTSLDFQFPNGRATLHMDLIVTSQEAGS